MPLRKMVEEKKKTSKGKPKDSKSKQRKKNHLVAYDYLLTFWAWFKKWGKRALIVLGAILGFFLVFAFFIWLFFGRSRLTDPAAISWGVTYSSLQADELQLDDEAAYRAVVDDLKPSSLRLIAYWNRIESEEGKYDFSELDFQVKHANRAKIPYIIAVGQRVPRYPECHIPGWVNNKSPADKDQKLLDFITKTIKRYDDEKFLLTWQIENEPFVGSFGDCPDLDNDLLRLEVETARRLTDKQILITESGELSFWFKAANLGDLLGTTLYRTVIIGKSSIIVRHVFPPWYYRARSNIVKALNPNINEVIVAELQGEPWTTKPLIETTDKEILRTMNRVQFERNIDFTESVGFPEVYWWGVEWWYWEKETKDNDYYWNRTRRLFRD